MRGGPEGSALLVTRYKPVDEARAAYATYYAEARAALRQRPPEDVDALFQARGRKPSPPGTASKYLVVFEGVNGPARAMRVFFADAKALAARHPGARIFPVAGLGPSRRSR